MPKLVCFINCTMLGFLILLGTAARAEDLPLPPGNLSNNNQSSLQSQSTQLSPQSDQKTGNSSVASVAASSNNDPSVQSDNPKASNQMKQSSQEKKDQANKSSDQTADPVRERAFVDMTTSLLPMTRDQINRLHALSEETQRAAAQDPGIPAMPTSSSLLVDLAPGSTAPVVRLGAGYVSSIVFLDGSGAPWPIQSYDVGNPNAFNIQWDKKSNILMIQAISLFKRGNLVVLLKGLSTPIPVSLMTGQKAIDYRVDLRVPGLGPNAKIAYDHAPHPASTHLIKVLDGIPPVGSKALCVEGGEASAWLIDDYILLRTKMRVLSPAWISTMSGPDSSIHVYQLPKVAVVLATSNGEMVQLRIKGF